MRVNHKNVIYWSFQTIPQFLLTELVNIFRQVLIRGFLYFLLIKWIFIEHLLCAGYYENHYGCFSIPYVARLCRQGQKADKCHQGKRPVHDSRSLWANIKYARLTSYSLYLQERIESAQDLAPCNALVSYGPSASTPQPTSDVTASTTPLCAAVEGSQPRPHGSFLWNRERERYASGPLMHIWSRTKEYTSSSE